MFIIPICPDFFLNNRLWCRYSSLMYVSSDFRFKSYRRQRQWFMLFWFTFGMLEGYTCSYLVKNPLYFETKVYSFTGTCSQNIFTIFSSIVEFETYVNHVFMLLPHIPENKWKIYALISECNRYYTSKKISAWKPTSACLIFEWYQKKIKHWRSTKDVWKLN